MIDLDKAKDEVDDRESFLKFVRALIKDRENEMKKSSPGNPYGPGANGWENGTIESYLDAALSWVEDSKGGEHELPLESSWRSFARFLYAGKSYE